MRQEDKEVDGPDLEQADERKRQTELVEKKEHEVHDLDGLPETTLDGERTQAVTAAMRAILDRDQLVVNDLQLPKRQLVALEALKSAVEGKDTQLSRFVFAQDRRALLEQALAVLQPELASMRGAGDQFKDMIAKVGELRERLDVLEDSEAEGLIEGRVNHFAKDANDTDDKDDDDDLDDKKTSASGDNEKDKKPKTDGAEDLSLDGPERPLEPKGPTTLGDPEEIAESARSEPRWRRSGG